MVLWQQRDLPDPKGKIASRDWLDKLKQFFSGRTICVAWIPDLTPETKFDFNDWLRTQPGPQPSEVEWLIEYSESIEPESGLFTGVDENDAAEWEKILPWLLQLRRDGIATVIVHHTGVDPSRMRGTTKREDPVDWILRLDNCKEDYSEAGTHFISRFKKYRGSLYGSDNVIFALS